jgi:prophage regulatory protein
MLSNTSKIVRLPAVQALTGLGRDSIYRLIRQGQFPRQIKISERASGWYEHEVLEHNARRAARRADGAA